MWIYLWNTNLTGNAGGGGLEYDGRYCICFLKCPHTYDFCIQVVKEWEILRTDFNCRWGNFPLWECKMFIPVHPVGWSSQYNCICLYAPYLCGSPVPFIESCIARSSRCYCCFWDELCASMDVYSYPAS